MSSIRTILHPTDFSDCSRYAFRLAGMLAREQGGRLVILHVNPRVESMVPDGGVLAALEPEESRDKVLKILRRMQVSAPKIQVEHRLIDGEGVPEILQQAQEVGADLIVMGTHGRTGLSRLLIGSVAGEVSRHARCPVITVKLPQAVDRAIRSPAAESVAMKETVTVE